MASDNSAEQTNRQEKRAIGDQEMMRDLACRFLIPTNSSMDATRVMLEVEQAHWYYLDYYGKEGKLHSFAPRLFHHFPPLDSDENRAADHIKHLKEQMSDYKRKIPVYGCIILNPDLNRILLVREINSGSLSFPRGKRNQSEEEVACAIREVREETGIDVDGKIHPNQYAYIDKRHQGSQFVKLFFVEMDTETDIVAEPLAINEISLVQWFSIDHMIKYDHEHYLLKDFLPFISSYVKERCIQKNRTYIPAASHGKILYLDTQAKVSKSGKSNALTPNPLEGFHFDKAAISSVLNDL